MPRAHGRFVTRSRRLARLRVAVGRDVLVPSSRAGTPASRNRVGTRGNCRNRAGPGEWAMALAPPFRDRSRLASRRFAPGSLLADRPVLHGLGSRDGGPTGGFRSLAISDGWNSTLANPDRRGPVYLPPAGLPSGLPSDPSGPGGAVRRSLAAERGLLLGCRFAGGLRVLRHHPVRAGAATTHDDGLRSIPDARDEVGSAQWCDLGSRQHPGHHVSKRPRRVVRRGGARAS